MLVGLWLPAGVSAAVWVEADGIEFFGREFAITEKDRAH